MEICIGKCRKTSKRECFDVFQASKYHIDDLYTQPTCYCQILWYLFQTVRSTAVVLSLHPEKRKTEVT